MPRRSLLLAALAALLALPAAAQPAPTPPARPLPYPVFLPPAFEAAVERGTRTLSGEPGPRYWQQRTDYALTATLDPGTNTLAGKATIRYTNNSPDTLGTLVLKLRQNLHAEGVPRNRPVEVTGGVAVSDVQVDGRTYGEGSVRQAGHYSVEGTLMAVRLAEPLLPGGTATVSMNWRFRIPAEGAPRMGQDGEVYYLAYWYPQMAVYDDVVGWDADPYLGLAEHYMGYGDYDVRITVPEGWIVRATGALRNPEEVLTETVRQRLAEAAAQDSVVHVVTADERRPGLATADSESGTLTWHFAAEDVRDFAFGTSAAYVWDATRAHVGDRDGDGADDFAMIHAVYRPGTPSWGRSAEFGRFSIEHLSEQFFPYPYPHMTTVEGLIGGGMEFPMMTLIGGGRSDESLFGVTYHEIAHMWFPMIVGQNETAYTWMDEGLTSYNTAEGEDAFWPEGDAWRPSRQYHYYLAGSGEAVEPMRHGDLFPAEGAARVVASYSTPAVLLRAVEGIYGAERFWAAYRAYAERWAFKHPYPYDLFHAFEDVLGEDLDWLWTPTLFETWTVDHAVAGVTAGADGVTVRVADRGLAPMPAPVVVTYADGRTERRTVPVQTWLAGRTEAEVTFPAGEVARVEIDPGGYLPDVDRANNVSGPPAPSGVGD